MREQAPPSSKPFKVMKLALEKPLNYVHDALDFAHKTAKIGYIETFLARPFEGEPGINCFFRTALK